MPAPTALLRRPEELAAAQATPLPLETDDEGSLLVDVNNGIASARTKDLVQVEDTEMQIDEEGRPHFPPAKSSLAKQHRSEMRKVAIPPHRLTPLKQSVSLLLDASQIGQILNDRNTVG